MGLLCCVLGNEPGHVLSQCLSAPRCIKAQDRYWHDAAFEGGVYKYFCSKMRCFFKGSITSNKYGKLKPDGQLGVNLSYRLHADSSNS